MKEALKTVKEVTLVTAAGAAEGAIIGGIYGGSMSLGTLAIPSSLFGGALGAATALSGEVVGRLSKRDITVKSTDVGQLDHPTETQTKAVTAEATVSMQNVPLIKVPDTIRTLRNIAIAETAGTWRSTHTQVTSSNVAKEMTMEFKPKQIGRAKVISSVPVAA